MAWSGGPLPFPPGFAFSERCSEPGLLAVTQSEIVCPSIVPFEDEVVEPRREALAERLGGVSLVLI